MGRCGRDMTAAEFGQAMDACLSGLTEMPVEDLILMEKFMERGFIHVLIERHLRSGEGRIA